jgi:hypothetical protein
MRRTVFLIVVGWALTAEAGGVAPGKTESEAAARVRQLQDRFTQRLYEEALPRLKGTASGGSEASQIVFPMAERIWKDVFGPEQALLRRRAGEILADLGPAAAVEEANYVVVAEANELAKIFNASDLPKDEKLLRIGMWNPVAAAQSYSQMLTVRTLGAEKFLPRAMLGMLGDPIWEVADRDFEHPKLVQRLGPELLIVELARKDDSYYLPGRVRWLRTATAAETVHPAKRYGFETPGPSKTTPK